MKVAQGVRLRERRHRRDALPGRRVLLPRDEHPAPGGALRHRDGHVSSTSSPSRSASPTASRCRSPRTRSSAAATRSSAASTPRTRPRASCRRRARSRKLAAPGGPGRALGRRLRRGRHHLAVLRQPRRQARRVGTRPRRGRRTGCCGRCASCAIEGIHTTIPAHLALLAHPDFAAGNHSTKWLEEEVDLAGLSPTTGAGAGRGTDGDAEAPELVERTVPVEVNGKRFSVRLWLPDAPAAAPATGARAARGRAAAAASSGGGAGNGTITAPMQGTIVKVLVERGRHGRGRSGACSCSRR